MNNHGPDQDMNRPLPILKPASPAASQLAVRDIKVPRVAVIVPAYGVAHLLPEALSSVQAQTLCNWECVVVDDGAPDDVAGAVGPFLDDPRMTFLQTGNGGVSFARNRAIAETRAPYIALLDGDDLLRPTYLEQMVNALEADPQARLATCNARIFGAVPRDRTCFTRKQGRGDGTRGSLPEVLDQSFKIYIGSTFRRDDYESVGGFDTTMTHAEDFDFWVRLVLLGGHALYLDDILGDYRVRGNSASASSAKMLKGNIRVFEKALDLIDANTEPAEIAWAMIEENERQLRFEQAIGRVIDGDRAAIAEMQAARGHELGRAWNVAFAVWKFLPALAAPVLRYRRQKHARGAISAAGMRAISQAIG